MKLKTLKKCILPMVCVSAAAFALNANAECAGPYVGGQLGWGTIHQSGFDSITAVPGGLGTVSNSSTDSGLAGRVFGGYQFTQNFAAEMGYTKFKNMTAKMVATDALNNSATFKSTVKTDAIDLVGKFILPLQNGFQIYAKAGAAYLHEQASNEIPTTVVTTKAPKSQHKVLPTFGVGAGYELAKNLVADVSWNRIQKVGNSSNLNSTDFVGVGLTYNFG